MPLGPYKDFDECTRKQRRRGLAKENAARYCGAIKRDVEAARDPRFSPGQRVSFKSYSYGTLTGEVVANTDEGVLVRLDEPYPPRAKNKKREHIFQAEYLTPLSSPEDEDDPYDEAFEFEPQQMIVVSANEDLLRETSRIPWFAVHYDYLSSDLESLGFRVYLYSDYIEPDDPDDPPAAYPVQWVMRYNSGDAEDKYALSRAKDLAESYNDTIGPISVSITDNDDWMGDSGRDDEGGGGGDDDRPPTTPRAPGSQSLKQPKQLVASAAADRQALSALEKLPKIMEDGEPHIRVSSAGLKGRPNPLVFMADGEALYRVNNGDSESRSFDVSEVQPAQSTVSVSGVKQKLNKSDNLYPPIVVKSEGKLYLLDGHHRVVAGLLKGERRFDAEYVDLDAEYDDDDDYDDDYDLEEEMNYAEFKRLESEGAFDDIKKKRKKPNANAAITPDDWSYDFPTLLDALEFKQRLEKSGPMGQQIARKLVWRKKRLRYIAYDLPQTELTYLRRFTGEDRGPWQKRPPHDDVI